MDVELENQREAEKESDFDGNLTQAAVTTNIHKRAANKQKYYTLGNQKKRQKLPVSFSTVSKGTNGNSKTRGALMPATFIQGSSEKMMSVLEERGGAAGVQDSVEVLKHTLQTFLMPAELSWSWGKDGRADTLEPSWTDIVRCHESMSKIQRHQQEALWEFIHTELIYINKLTIVTDFVLAALEYVRHRGFLHEVSSAHLFSNLPSILGAHRLFWQEVIYPVLQAARLAGQPLDPLKLEPGCLQFSERFSAYLDYCWEEEKNVEFTRRQLETNPYFHVFVMWAENHPQCRRMRLGDMQAKPHQRITKYPLLLKAILKTTQDQPTQHALHRMLRSVSQFLDSINDYLQFKEDELDLFDLSQRIEGYELQGMGEEIDKHIREFCHFNLTSPVRGAGPKAIRKLLLEEPLKVRGRKDSKLEVNALLFTDVLLLTKAQKKSEKQKVVHPLLALERIHCAELKDGNSFVLVEVSDLGCPVSVYSVSAPSSERCTAWVSAINQAQETLETLRKKEITESKEPSVQLELEESETLSSITQSTEDTEEQSDEFTLSQIKPGLPHTGNHLEAEDIPHVEREEQYLHTEPVQMNCNQMQNRARDLNDEASQESAERNVGKSEHCEESFIGFINERRVTWTHRTLTNSSDISQRNLSENNKSNGTLLVSGLLEDTVPSQSSRNVLSGHMDVEPALRNAQSRGVSSAEGMRQEDPNEQTRESESLQDSWHTTSCELLTNSEKFTRKINSPRLQRKRPINSQLSAPPQDSREMAGETGLPKCITNRNSFTNSDRNRILSRSSNSSSKNQESHLVLKLASIKQNREVLWNIAHERLSPEPQTLCELELPKETPHQNSLEEPKVKNQSSSIPKVIYTGAHILPLSVAEPPPSPPSGLDLQLCTSPLQGILARAKERERDREAAKREGKPVVKSASSVSITTSPHSTVSSLPSVDREVEAEQLQAFRPRLNCFCRAKESRVDDREKDRRNSLSTSTSLGASVDWPGWCFDDEEVLEFLGPDSGRLAWVDKALSVDELKDPSRQEEGEYSEV